MNIRCLLGPSIIGLLLLSPLLHASDQLPQWLQPLLPNDSQTAMWVEDTHTGKVLVSYNADKMMLPASTQKLLIATAAWQQLGADFRFHTRLLTNGNVENGTLNGDLWLQFGADPRLTRAQLAQLAWQLQQLSVNRINGNLILLDEDDGQWKAPGWVWDDLGICYAAPISQFILDQNCVKGLLQQQGAQTQVKLLLPAPMTVTSSATFNHQPNAPFCELMLESQPNNHFLLKGCYPGQSPVPLAIAVNEPKQFALESASGVFADFHPKKVLFAPQLPANHRVLVDFSSDELKQLISEMLLDSDNLIADTLLKQLGRTIYGNGYGFEAGVKAMRDTLADLEIPLTNSHLVDGSGLSRYNLLSAQQLAQLLRQLPRKPQLQWLADALPQAGISGTLQYRRPFTQGPLKGAFVAKTGSMTGVQNLAGYLSGPSNKDKHRYLFVIMENGLSPQAKQQKRYFANKVLPVLQQQLQPAS